MKKDCERIRDILQEYLDDALPEAAAAEVAEHIELCEDCAHEFRLLVKLDAALRSEPMEEPPGSLTAAVRARLVQTVAISWRDAALAAASIALVTGVFWLIGHYEMYAVVGSESLDLSVPLSGVFGVDHSAFDFSLSEIGALVLDSYSAAVRSLTDMAGGGFGAFATVLLIATALLAMGTNALCFHRARIKHITPNRP